MVILSSEKEKVKNEIKKKREKGRDKNKTYLPRADGI